MTKPTPEALAQQFIEMLNVYHAKNEVWDAQLDSQIHGWYVNPPNLFPKKPYFSPSASGSSQRELYLKQLGAKRDNEGQPPHQKRWTTLGTAIGDVIQRDLLFAEKHYKKLTGVAPAFVFERNADGTPVFEDFAKRNVPVSHRGHDFYLYGTCDGIMRYTAPDGSTYRVGLEIKSKQTTHSKTSAFSMKGAEDKHIKQAVAYSHMYRDTDTGQPLDYYIILYVNASKKGWFTTYDEAPDVRAFAYEFTDTDRAQLFDYFTEVLDAVKTQSIPPFDIDAWTFNSYKTATAKSLTDAELTEVKEFVKRALKSGIPDYKKEQYHDAYQDIIDRRAM
ncbi:hypothetical protein [Listeria booriae]|uniref:hypothetical protein n=1 Tax=Listeria booriae TaxID=1552123 RepID=UPI00163DC6B5|nr:hypothetical protein [Listeria booriae]MBC1306851.1 hypothetical protein [Listeria booriae]